MSEPGYVIVFVVRESDHAQEVLDRLRRSEPDTLTPILHAAGIFPRVTTVVPVEDAQAAEQLALEGTWGARMIVDTHDLDRSPP